ncbi:MAG: DUF502 domain-containing protein [Candidatus Riflebacteria bacterium]|nr:DUF502 domain-containing protein [Candidatus Riflebacteria bacterium]
MDREKLKNVLSVFLDILGNLYSVLRSYFFTGLILVVPMAVTVYVVFILFQAADGLLGNALSQALGYNIPGVGLISTMLILMLFGVIAQNVIGKRFLHWLDISLQSLPMVRSLYMSVKQVSDVLFKNQPSDFQRVVMIEFPHEKCWTLGFITGDFPTGICRNPISEKMVCVFVPATPNPTSGFLLFVDKDKVMDTNLGIEEAMKMIISVGLVKPGLTNPIPPYNNFEDFTIPH